MSGGQWNPHWRIKSEHGKIARHGLVAGWREERDFERERPLHSLAQLSVDCSTFLLRAGTPGLPFAHMRLPSPADAGFGASVEASVDMAMT